MAKSLRARSKKVNRSKLRTTVFGPIEDARTERLSTKLIELALSQTKNQPSDYQSLVKTDEARNMELNTLATQHGEKEEPQPVGSQSEHKTVGASGRLSL